MDFTPIIAQVWGMPIWFIPAALLIGLLKSPWTKGHIGELLVRLVRARKPTSRFLSSQRATPCPSSVRSAGMS